MIRMFLRKLRAKRAVFFSRYCLVVLCELIRVNFKLMESSLVLGSLWSLLGPIGMLAVLYFVFRSRFGVGISAYPLYLLIGIVLINFFVTVTASLLRVFFSNRELALNSAVPREILILANFSMSMYKFLIEFLFCGVISVFCGFLNWRAILWAIPLLLAYSGLLLGTGFILSALFCFAKDIEHLWALVSRLFFFVTPIFYSLNDLSLWGKVLVYYLNPLTPFLVSFRGILMGNVSFFSYFYSLTMGGLFFIVGYAVFVLLENTMVEKI